LESVIARQFQIVNDFRIETEKFRKFVFVAGNVDERIFWNFHTFAKLYSLTSFEAVAIGRSRNNIFSGIFNVARSVKLHSVGTS